MKKALDRFDVGEFFEIFEGTPLEVCELRDAKRPYAKARAGELNNFTGVDSVYEQPKSVETVLKTADSAPPDAVKRVFEKIF